MPRLDRISTTPPRIAFAINSLAGGGAERVMSTLLEYFSNNPETLGGAELHLVLLDQSEDRYPVPAKIKVHRLNGSGGWLKSIRLLRTALHQLRPSVCVSFLTRANCANVLAAPSAGHVCVISERVNTTSHFGSHPIGLINRSIVRALYPRANHVIANSVGVRADLVENYRVAPARISVISNPLDLDFIRTLGSRAQEALMPRPYAIAMGRLTKNKNFRLLIRAFADSGVGIDLVVLGEGEEREALLQEAIAVGISDRIHLVGFISNPYPIIKSAEFFVSASNAEGFPNAIAEAMALGVPVVATDCPSGPSELLQGSAPAGVGVCMASYGILVPIKDQTALADAIRRICDPEVQATYRLATQQRMDEFRLEVIAEEYATTIRSVISR